MNSYSAALGPAPAVASGFTPRSNLSSSYRASFLFSFFSSLLVFSKAYRAISAGVTRWSQVTSLCHNTVLGFLCT